MNETHFRSLVESMPDAIISANAQGNIVFWSPAAQKIFGYGEDEVLGKSLTVLMPKRYHAAHLRGFQRFLENGQSNLIGKTIEVGALRKDGTEFPADLSLATWNNQDKIFFTAILRDITARKLTDDTLAENRKL